MTHTCRHVVRYVPWTLCEEPATRTREGWNGAQEHWCALHDPIRREQDQKNAKARRQSKRDRWKKQEASRRT